LVTFAGGCSRMPATPAGPAEGTGQQASITAEPRSARPDFLPTPTCPTRPAFGVRLSIIIRGSHGLTLRGFRFQFIDRLGGRTLPEVIPIPTPSATSSLPSSSPIPIPGFAALPASPPVLGGLPFFVRFGCNVIPEGTLLVTADAGHEAFEMPEVRIRIGQ
jgi:hypothetical protein